MKIYDVDTFVIQKVINKLIDEKYSNNTVKKNKHMISQFFEYAIDNKWVSINPILDHRDVKTTITVYNSVNSDYIRETTDRLNMKIQKHSIEKEIEGQEKSNEITTITTENEYTKNVEIPTLQNVEEVNNPPTVSEMPNQEDDEDELTDEEIDRMIRALERKKKRKEKDFEM